MTHQQQTDHEASLTLLKPNSAPNFDTHELIGDDRLEVSITAIIRLFYRVGLVVGVGVMLLAFREGQSAAIGLFAVGALLTVVTLLLYRRLNRRVVFDPVTEAFWSGGARRPPTTSVAMSEVVAIQVLTEACRTSNGHHYTRYEINLI